MRRTAPAAAPTPATMKPIVETVPTVWYESMSDCLALLGSVQLLSGPLQALDRSACLLMARTPATLPTTRPAAPTPKAAKASVLVVLLPDAGGCSPPAGPEPFCPPAAG